MNQSTQPNVATIVANLATMNIDVLKTLPIDQVLPIHPFIDAQNLTYTRAIKTKSIKVKPINCILGAQIESVVDYLAMKTLEGYQNITANSFVCVGMDTPEDQKDFWQQSESKLHAKYRPISMDANGWVIYEPIGTEETNACQIDASTIILGPKGGFCIVNPWWGDVKIVQAELLHQLGIKNPNPKNIITEGERTGCIKVFLHYGIKGDWVLQNTSDAVDTYRVAQAFFKNTYDML